MIGPLLVYLMLTLGVTLAVLITIKWLSFKQFLKYDSLEQPKRLKLCVKPTCIFVEEPLLLPMPRLITVFLLGALMPLELLRTLRNALLALASLCFSDWIILRISAYSARTPKTWMIQETTQVSTAVRPSALGA